jgi:hypothetical protein
MGTQWYHPHHIDLNINLLKLCSERARPDARLLRERQCISCAVALEARPLLAEAHPEVSRFSRHAASAYVRATAEAPYYIHMISRGRGGGGIG